MATCGHNKSVLRAKQKCIGSVSSHAWKIPLLLNLWLALFSVLLVLKVDIQSKTGNCLGFLTIAFLSVFLCRLNGLWLAIAKENTSTKHQNEHRPTQSKGNEKYVVTLIISAQVADRHHVINRVVAFHSKKKKTARFKAIMTVLCILTVLLVLFLLLLLAGDVERNPGPVTLNDVYEELYPIRYKWYEIGVHLELEQGRLNSIEMKNRSSPKDCLLDVLSLMFRSSEPTWEYFVHILRDIEEYTLAEQIVLKHCRKTEPEMTQPSATHAIRRTQSEVSDTTKLSQSNLEDVLETLLPLRHKWKFVGLALHMSPRVLDRISRRYRDDPSDCLFTMVTEWLESDSEPTWEKLIQALRTRSVGEKAAALELERKFCKSEHAHPSLDTHSMRRTQSEISDTTKLSQSDVLETLLPLRHKWKFVGLALYMSPRVLDRISRRYRDDLSDCLFTMVTEWLESDSEPTWEKLIQALRTRIVGEKAAALELERKFCKSEHAHPSSDTYSIKRTQSRFSTAHESAGAVDSHDPSSAPRISAVEETQCDVSPKDLRHLMEVLEPDAHSWVKLGRQLGFKSSELVSIMDNSALAVGGDVSFLGELLDRWLQGKRDQPTLKKLSVALSTIKASDKVIEELAQFQKQSTQALNINDLFRLHTKLKDVSQQWFKIGAHLGLSPSTLMRIERENPIERDPERCLFCMLQEWLQRVEPKPSVDTLVRALNFIHEKILADIVQESYGVTTVQQKKGTSVPISSSKDRERQVLEVLSKQPSVSVRILNVLMIGSPGVGKTHLFHLLQNLPPPLLRENTPDSQKLLVLGDSDMVAMTVNELLSTLVQSSACASPKKAETVDIKSMVLSEASEIEDDFNKIIVSSSPGFSPKEVTLIHIIESTKTNDLFLFSDANISAIIFVINLSTSLDDRHTIEYHDAGRPLGSYCSDYTQLQEITNLVKSLQSLQLEGKHKAKTVIVGTHADLLRNRYDATTEMNYRITEALKPFLTDSDGTLIFRLNTRSPTEDDKKVVSQLIRTIRSQCYSNGENVPVSWFVLLYYIKELMNKLGRKVLRLSECIAYASKLCLNTEGIQKALNYLSKSHLVLFYPSQLPELILHPDIVNEKLSTLRKLRMKLHAGPTFKSSPISNVWLPFRSTAFVSVEMLNSLPEHYVDKVFTSKEFIIILKKLCLIVSVSKDYYFMPSVLSMLSPKELNEQRSATSICPLIMQIHNAAPSFVFPALVCVLLESKNLFHLDTTQITSFKNCIRLQFTEYPGNASVIDSFEYIEVHLNAPPSTLKHVCSSVRKCLQDALLEICRLRNLSLQHEFGFPCMCCKPRESYHPAFLQPNNQYLVCVRDPEICGTLSSSHLLWLGLAEDTTEATVTSASSCYERPPTVKDSLLALRNELSPGELFELGMFLQVRPHRMAEFDVELRRDFSKQLRSVLEAWLYETPDPKWSDLTEALQIIGRSDLSEQIKQAFLI